MTKIELNLRETQEMFIYIGNKMIENKGILTSADQAIGDGDHGIGMARGFEAVTEKLNNSEFSTMGELFKSIGMELLTSIGGAAGAIFGTFFRGASKNLEEALVLNSENLSKCLWDGLFAVKKRGGAKLGDKTMVDALEPAAIKSKEFIEQPINVALSQICREAQKGMEQTKNMTAEIGKAKTLGERSLGHPDPGAISISLILKYMLDYIHLNKN